jgi:magnesium-transporting ATPase (P-type)
MITGDHPQTAMSIGQMLGITNSEQAVTGYELERWTTPRWRKRR